MWAEVNGERKKVACGPCIRGHRSSKCDHRDRVLVEVRKPGRPLSSCPHPSGSCSCERVVINYTIPKSSECACPSERTQPVATVAGNSRIQKPRRKSTAPSATALEKAMRAGQDFETDASSYSRTSTERSASNVGSPPSSASSTPRLSPKRSDSIASCCQSKPVQRPVEPPPQGGGCCSSKAKQAPAPIPEAVPVKSCCSSKNVQNAPKAHQYSAQHYGQQIQFQLQAQTHPPQFPQPQAPVPIPASFPFGLGAPIYNHAAAAYQQAQPVSMSPVMHGSHLPGQQAPEHNCHCGDGCSCFGCAAHPNNATMMEYVRLMAQFQYTGGFGTMSPPLYDLPAYPHHPGFGAEAHPPVGINTMAQSFSPNLATPTQQNMQYRGSIDMSAIPSALAVSTSWQQPSVPARSATGPQYFESTSYVSSTPITEVQSMLKTEDSIKTPVADSPRDGKDEEPPTLTLSPSSYFWNQMTLPGCNDATGTCQCGDGCECVGCLTHGGHNGVQLEASAMGQHTTFSDFTADTNGLHLDDTTDFLFNTAQHSA